MKIDIQNYRIPLQLSSIIFLVVSALYFSPIADILQKTITLPINFHFRHILGQDVELTPELKVYAFDDSTLNYLDRPDLSLEEWSALLTAIAAAKPKAIYIDKIFGVPETEGRDLFVRSVSNIDVPIVVGGFIHKNLARKSGLIDLDRANLYEIPPGSSTSSLRRLPRFSGYFYGPHQSIQSVFKQIGHLLYDGDGRTAPLVLHGEKIIPHLALSLAQYKFTDDDVKISDHLLPIDRDGMVTVNMAASQKYADTFVSLKSAITRTKLKLPFSDVIKEGQTILILPAIYTGNSDWVQTPVGYIPGGYVVASLLNSVLTRNWLTYSSIDLVLCAVLVWIGAMLAAIAPPMLWLGGIILGACILWAMAIAAFVGWGIISSWPLLLISFIVPSLILFSWNWQRRSRQFRDEKIQQKSLHDAAVAVQDGLFHDKKLLRGPCVFAASHHSADRLGGDWYGFYEYPEHDCAFLLIGDVTGHGFSSALLVGAVAGAINATLNSMVNQGYPTARCLEILAQRVNLVVLEAGYRIQKNMTMAFVGLDLHQKKGYLVNCAHPPIVVKNQQSIRTIAVGGELLGVSPSLPLVMREWALAEGDIIFAYTDGLLENCGPKGETFRRSDIKKQLMASTTPFDLVANIRQATAAKWQLKPLQDDCSYCAVALGKKAA